jgi:hypothetical protein
MRVNNGDRCSKSVDMDNTVQHIKSNAGNHDINDCHIGYSDVYDMRDIRSNEHDRRKKKAGVRRVRKEHKKAAAGTAANILKLESKRIITIFLLYQK